MNRRPKQDEHQANDARTDGAPEMTRITFAPTRSPLRSAAPGAQVQVTGAGAGAAGAGVSAGAASAGAPIVTGTTVV